MIPAMFPIASFLAAYNIANAGQFNGTASQLAYTPSVSGSAQKWTAIFWFLPHAIPGADQTIFGAGADTNNRFYFRYGAGGRFEFTEVVGGVNQCDIFFAQYFRDVAAPVQCVLQYDSTQAAQDDRLKLKINGVDFDAAGGTRTTNTAIPSSHNLTYWNSSSYTMYIGQHISSQYLNATLAEFYFANNETVAETDVGKFAANGNWIAKKYILATGTNNTFQDFVTVGTDASANGNDWTPTSVTQVTSTPTNTACSLNPLTLFPGTSGTLSNGNTKLDPGSTADECVYGTLIIKPGQKVYVEGVYNITLGSGSRTRIGVTSTLSIGATRQGGASSGDWAFSFLNGTPDAAAVNEGSVTTYSGLAPADGSVVGVAIDTVNGYMYAHDDNTYYNSGDPTSGASGTGAISTIPTDTDLILHVSIDAGGINRSTLDMRFSEGEFSHQPTGYNAITTDSLLDNSAINLDDYFTTVLTSGTGGARSVASGLDAVDLCLAKSLDGTSKHWQLACTGLLGSNQIVYTSNANPAEDVTTDVGGGGIGSLSSGNINIVAGTVDASNLNESGKNFVFYNWKLPSSETNTSGTISIDWKFNATSGWAAGKYPGNATSGATLGIPSAMGALGAPKMLIVKNLTTGALDFNAYHEALGATKYLTLSGTGAAATATNRWNDTPPTSSVITLGNAQTVNDNASSDEYLIIAIWDTELCKVFSYEGNNSSDGTFVSLPGAMEWGLFKNVDLAGTDHMVYDKARDPFNNAYHELKVNSTAIENSDSADSVFMLSNGVKHANTSNQLNTAYTYVGVAMLRPQGSVEVPGQ